MSRRALLLTGLLGACAPSWDVGEEIGDDADGGEAEDDGIDEWSIGDQPEPDDSVFDQGFIHTIDIRFDDAAEDALWAEPYEWVRADADIDGVALEDVGLRLRGKIGSFRELDGKPKFKLDFNRFVDGRRFQDMEALSLNNSVVDCSFLKEPIAYAAFAAIGAPEIRTSYAQVTVNGAPYGLYVLIETQDDRFLKRNWDDASGNLYDGKYVWYGDRDYVLLDFGEGNDTLYQLEEGEDVGHADISGISEALVEAWGQPDFYARMGEVVDWEQVHRVWAGEQWAGQNDGYCLNKNNYRVYFDPDDGRADWIPWDMDYSFLRDSDWGRNWRQPTGNLAYGCFADETCRAAWQAEVERSLEIIDDAGLLELHDDLDALTQDAAEDDPRRECSRGDIRGWRGYTRDWVENRSDTVRWDWGI
jgi:spore coat protein CotH